MFNNANVIFRTKFVDGVSTVSRSIGVGSSRSLKSSKKGNRAVRNEKMMGTPANNRNDKENIGIV
jgi:structural maintenance of chromosome 2